MEIDARSKICPVCNYQFGEQPTALKWIALALVLLFFFYLLFF